MEKDKFINHSTGMPFVSLFSHDRKPIIEPLSGIPLGAFVNDFYYEYNEGEDEDCYIEFVTDNPDLLEMPELGDKARIIVQWGVVMPNGSIEASPTRLLIKRDEEWSGNESDGIHISIKLTDKFSLFSNEPADRTYDLFGEWVKYKLQGISTKFLDYNVYDTLDINGNKYSQRRKQ